MSEHDKGQSWPTVATVNLMLRQLERDRATSYWGEPPHSESLDGAESWLLSLRDWLETNPAMRKIHSLIDCWCGTSHNRQDFL